MRLPAVSRRAATVALAAYSCFLAVVLLAPSSGEQSRAAGVLVDLGRLVGFGSYATQGRAEFIANVLILMPVSALGSLVWMRSRWRDWTAWGFVLAASVELVQGIALSARTASFADVVANTLGATGGALVVAAFRASGLRSASEIRFEARRWRAWHLNLRSAAREGWEELDR